MTKSRLEIPVRIVKTRRQFVPIFDIPVDSTRKERVLEEILRFLAGLQDLKLNAVGKRLLIVTPNPEILVYASTDSAFASILRNASLCLPDGVGVVMAQRFLSLPAVQNPLLRPVDILRQGLLVGLSAVFNRRWLFACGEVVPGRVVFEELVEVAAERGLRVFLLGGAEGIAQKAAEKLLRRYPKLKVKSARGPWLDKEGRPQNAEEVWVERDTVGQINRFEPDLLFVAFGHPKQEFWFDRNLPHLHARVAMVVGGALDYAAGAVVGVPKWVSEANLEWLWRLVTQPRRAKRIATALFVFPWLVFWWKACKLPLDTV